MTIKVLALILMFIDHIGVFFSRELGPDLYLLCRAIGRLAFPIFAFSLAKGYRRTSNLAHYWARLVAFAILSEQVKNYAYQLAGLTSYGRNILYSLSVGLCFLAACDLIIHSWRDVVIRFEPIRTGPDTDLSFPQFRVKFGDFTLSPKVGLVLGSCLALLSLFIAWYFDLDYGIYGQFLIWAFYRAEDVAGDVTTAEKGVRAYKYVFAVNLIFFLASLLLDVSFGDLQLLSVLAVPICYRDEPSRPKPSKVVQYFFYAFYPAHLLALALIKHYLVT